MKNIFLLSLLTILSLTSFGQEEKPSFHIVQFTSGQQMKCLVIDDLTSSKQNYDILIEGQISKIGIDSVQRIIANNGNIVYSKPAPKVVEKTTTPRQVKSTNPLTNTQPVNAYNSQSTYSTSSYSNKRGYITIDEARLINDAGINPYVYDWSNENINYTFQQTAKSYYKSKRQSRNGNTLILTGLAAINIGALTGLIYDWNGLNVGSMALGTSFLVGGIALKSNSKSLSKKADNSMLSIADYYRQNNLFE